MNRGALWAAICAATSVGMLNAEAFAQNATSNVVQGATNVVIINNSVVGKIYSPAPSAYFDGGVSVPDRTNRGQSLWSHNNSIVALEAQGNQRRFYYHRPRAGMAVEGARSGSLLFEGTRSGNSYTGTARIFAGACGIYTYDVSGPVIADRRVIVHGLAPQISQGDCRVHGYRPDTLVFDLI